MDKYFKLIICGIIVGVIGSIIFINHTSIEENTIIEIEDSKKEIDMLNHKVDSLENIKSNLTSLLDSSINNVQVIEKWYEKEYNDIMYQSSDSDCLFFSEYLSKNFAGFSGSNN